MHTHFMHAHSVIWHMTSVENTWSGHLPTSHPCGWSFVNSTGHKKTGSHVNWVHPWYNSSDMLGSDWSIHHGYMCAWLRKCARGPRVVPWSASSLRAMVSIDSVLVHFGSGGLSLGRWRPRRCIWRSFIDSFGWRTQENMRPMAKGCRQNDWRMHTTGFVLPFSLLSLLSLLRTYMRASVMLLTCIMTDT